MTVIYCILLLTFCLLGMATGNPTSCLSIDNELEIAYKYPNDTSAKSCTYTRGRKVVASSDRSIPQDKEYKKRAAAILSAGYCTLIIKDFSTNRARIFNCSIEGTTSVLIPVDIKTLRFCGGCNTLQFGSLTLLLSLFVSPLLSELL